MLHSPCKRGCCFTGLQVCARNRTCPCHAPTLTEWLGVRVADGPDVRLGHKDPTANTALRNLERQHKKGAAR